MFVNYVRDAIVINFVSFGTSLYAGIAVFSIIGFMAHEQNVPIEKVINSGRYIGCCLICNCVSLLLYIILYSKLTILTGYLRKFATFCFFDTNNFIY